MPPKLRQRRSQREVSVHTKHSQAKSAANVQGQDPPQPPPSDSNREVLPTNLMLELIQSLQQNQSELAKAIKQLKEKDAGMKTLPQNEGGNQEKPHQDSGSHEKETTFVTMSDVANLLKQEREKNPKEPRLFVKKPPYPTELLKQPYPEKYIVPTFSRFDGQKGSALVHISKFIDSMGAYAGNGDLCLREFSKSLDDRAYTWYTTMPPGFVKVWEDMVELFCGKYFQAEEKITLVNLHTTKQTRENLSVLEREKKGNPSIWYQSCIRAMVETRASQIAVLEKNMQKFQQQVDDHTGSIEGLHLKVDGLEAGVAEIRAMMQEVMKRLPVVEEPAVQTRQEEQSPNRVQANLGEQIPIAPREAHGVPLGAEVRNAMPMRPLNQDFRVRPNQPRVGMQTGEFFENGQNEPILGEFGDPIEERRNVGNNARFMPPFQGHFDAPYEEPWLGRRQGRQHGHQGQQAQFEPHAAPPRHGMHFGDPREDQWGLNDQDEAWFDPRRGRPARERPRQFQGAHHRDPYWQEQDGPPWNQGRARDPRPMKLDFPRFKGGDPTAWVYRALQYFHYYQVLEPEKVMHASYHLDEEALVWFQDCEHELHGWNDFVRAIQIRLAVKMQGPRNLGEAYALAKIQEEYLATVKRSTRPTYEPSRGSWVQSQAQQGAARVENKSGDSKQFSARPSMPVQRLTPMQMSERRKKGLCYNCDERWSSDHRCKNRKLYLMEEVEDEEAELIEIEEEEVEAELEDEKAEITLCALLGSTSPSTMRVIAILNGQKTVVLLDTGSTHNFMDGTLAKTLKLPIDVEIRAMMQEVMKRLPVVEEPAVQTRQEEQSPNRVQANLGEQIPIAPREAHGVPVGAELPKVSKKLRKTRRIQNSATSTNMFIILQQIAGLFEENSMRRFKTEPWNSLTQNKSDVDMDEPATASSAMTPTAIKTLQRNPRFRSLFNQLGLNPEARTAATEAIMAIATDSGAHCFTAETHASQAFLETTNAITFTDEDMEVQYPDHRRPLYLSATINEVQVRRALVDTGSCINLIPLSTIQAAEIPQEKIQGAPMEIKGFGGVGEYTKGHIQLVLKEEIKDAPEADLRDLLERKRKRRAEASTNKSQPQCVLNEVDVPESADTAETAAADPKISAKEELEQYDEMSGIDPELVAHSLNVEPGTKPVVQPIRTFHPEVEAQITQEVKKLLSAGFIKPIQHPRWLSNIVPVKKKNGQIRCCVDFRNLNKACPKDEFPLPNMDLLIDSTDAKKTAFRTPIRNFYYTVMPFGLKNAEATYQRTMTAMFHDMMHREIEDYVDNIVVKSKTRRDHFSILKKVFERCRLYKLKMNPLKCAFGVLAGKFLGFLVHQRGIDVDPIRASAIATMKPPTTHKELKSFLGKLSYIRRFIPGLAVVTSTFAPLLKKGAPFRWSTECQQAFEKVQDIMTKLPTVCAPIFGKPLRLYLASNSQAIGALIAQEDGSGVEQPVYYVSRTLKDAESRYSGAERSCLALIYASQRLRHYFLAHKLNFLGKITQFPGEINEVFLAGLADSIWTLKFNGSSTAASAGAGIVLYKDDGEAVTKSFKFDFPCSNNAAEYEAYLVGLAIAYEIGIKHLRVIGDSNLVVCQARGEFSLKEPSLAPYRAMAHKLEVKFSTFEIEHAQRNENRYTDALATLGSQITFEGEEMDVTICKKMEPITKSMKKEFEESSLDQEDWRVPIKTKLMSPAVTADLREIKDYTLISGDLYQRLSGGVLARCVSIEEAKEKLLEVHEKTCGDGGAVSLYRRLQRLGYFWPNMSVEAAEVQSQCPTCQFHYNNE
uniref:Uncharacterized protein n=1 Tax=Fagus sylvatica TaxID=28930 RepID=A0A2N9I2U7_FAGSY